MSGQNMESGSVSKRKESSVNEAVTSNGPRKRTKMTASRSKSKKSQHSESDGESAGENDGPDAFPVNPADFLSNLKNRYEEERIEYQREIDDLSAQLAASEKSESKWRLKYKNGVSELVEKKIASAEKRVSEAEEKLKQMKAKAKEDVVAIRAELVAAATEAVVANPQSTRSPDHFFKEADGALKKLRLQNPNRYSELVKAQPDFVQLATQLKPTDPTMRQPKSEDVVQSREVSSVPVGDAVLSTKQALKALEIDLVNASEDMRTNSTLANQKKTLCKKMLQALKEVEPLFLAHAQLAQAKPENTKPPTPSVEDPILHRTNQQLQFTISGLNLKLQDIRTKLEEEVHMRRKLESALENK